MMPLVRAHSPTLAGLESMKLRLPIVHVGPWFTNRGAVTFALKVAVKLTPVAMMPPLQLAAFVHAPLASTIHVPDAGRIVSPPLLPLVTDKRNCAPAVMPAG